MSGCRVLLIGDTEHVPEGFAADSPFDVAHVDVADVSLGSERPDCAVVTEPAAASMDELHAAGVPTVVFGDLSPNAMGDAVRAGVTAYVPADADDAHDLLRETVLAALDDPVATTPERSLERMTDAFFALDPSFRFTYLNDRAAELIDVDPDAVVGDLIWDVFPEAEDTQFQARYEHAMETGESVTFQEYFAPLDTWFSVTAYPSETGLSVYFRDVNTQVERERELERQRDHLALLAEFDAVIQDAIGTVAESDSRGDIERFVCERIVEAEAVEFAWMGNSGGPGRDITPTAAAGEGSEYLEDTTVTTDASDTGRGPAGRAAATEEVQVSNDIATDTDFEPWREAALEHGFRSSAAVPLAYRGRLYGVLSMYATHEDAFPEEVQRVLSQLGRNLAHAMNALERRNALVTDAQVELEFHIRDDGLFPTLAAVETGATIHLDGLVERSDGGYVAYLAVEDGDPAAVAELTPTDGASEASVIRSDAGDGLVSVVLDDVPVSNVLATHGAELVSATATADGMQVVARLPRSVDVRTVVEAVTESFEGVEFRAKRTREPPADGPSDSGSAIEFDLTDRQREALESALEGGYFDWPRRSTGEAIAESMGITAPTFQEHLRTAQQKLLDRVLDIGVEDA